MISIYFPVKYLTQENQPLLKALLEDFGMYYDDTMDVDLNYVIESLAIEFVRDRSVLVFNDENDVDMTFTIDELTKQSIPFDAKFFAEHDDEENIIGLLRPNMVGPIYLSVDSSYVPVLSIDKIKKILDSHDEFSTDTEILNSFINTINELDYRMEGNRIEDFA